MNFDISNNEAAKAAISAIFGVANDSSLIGIQITTTLELGDGPEVVSVIDREGLIAPEAPPPETMVSLSHTAIYLPKPFTMTTTVHRLTEAQMVKLDAFVAAQKETTNGL